MNFKEAYQKMLEGKKVRRKIWKAYWHYDKKTERCYSHIDDKYSDREVKEIIFEDSLADDWEVVEDEEKKKEYWKPKENEKYYFIEECSEDVGIVTNGEWRIDNFRFSIGNYFKTNKEAKHIIEKLKVIHELQKFAFENNEKEIDWNDAKQYKQFLIYDIEHKKVCIDYKTYVKSEPFNIYFTSFNIARKAIKTIGEDRIKKYYFDIEE